MELKKLRCPECGANFESNEKVSFCSHCGAKLYLDDGTKSININYKSEDMSKIKEIEANKEIELERMKIQEKHAPISRFRFYLYAFCSRYGCFHVGYDSNNV